MPHVPSLRTPLRLLRAVRAPAAALAALSLVGAVPPALAGQVRVNVSLSGQSVFAPADLTVNAGDQVCWVWNSAGHTVTSGTTFSTVGDGTFRSSNSGLASLSGFAWKVPVVDSVHYFCWPHFGTGMKAVIRVDPSGTTPTADFRITEVEFAGPGGVDRVQITNLGNAAGYLGRYRVSFASGVEYTYPSDPVFMDVGASIRVVINFGGSSSQTIFYTPTGIQLGSAGSFALYVPNSTLAGNGSTEPASLDDPDQLADYVEWGVPGQPASPNRDTAVASGRWPSGDVVDVTDLPNGGAGYSISFCGNRADRGSSQWLKTSPNFGAGVRCTTPTRATTWGRLKSVYR